MLSGAARRENCAIGQIWPEARPEDVKMAIAQVSASSEEILGYLRITQVILK
jgi:hypothetical protein